VVTEDARDALLAVKFVGPATADVLAAEDVSPDAFERKSISHAQLVAAGVNPGVAARIRREHSLQWSFEGGEDLDQRAEQVRGLQDDEREWVAKSYGEADASADGSGDAAAEEAAWQAEGPVKTDVSVSEADSDDEAAWREQSWPNGAGDSAVEHEEQAWREQSAPTPLTELEAIDEDDAALLSRAGVTSVRSLATAHVERVADSLGVSTERVEAWRDAAREHAD
jgi:hypothetical protein